MKKYVLFSVLISMSFCLDVRASETTATTGECDASMRSLVPMLQRMNQQGMNQQVTDKKTDATVLMKSTIQPILTEAKEACSIVFDTVCVVAGIFCYVGIATFYDLVFCGRTSC